MPDAHAFLSPSASHRWLHCTPSCCLEKGEPEQSSEFAQEGTIAHAMAEYILKVEVFDIPFDEGPQMMELYKDAEDHGFDPAEMERNVRYGYVENIRGIIGESEISFYGVERTVHIPGIDECWGTCDCSLLIEDNLHIIDLKYGRGVRVSAEDNSQLKIYAIGMLAAIKETAPLLTVNSVTLHILQPRLGNFSEWSVSVADLDRWRDLSLVPAAYRALHGEGVQVTGDWCRFCKIKGRCVALAALAEEEAVQAFEPMTLTDEEVAHALEVEPMVKAWCTAVEEYAHGVLMRGHSIPGWKLVAGRSTSKITDQDGAARVLKDAGYTSGDIYAPLTLKGTGELKKMLGTKLYRELMDPFITKTQGNPSIAPADDPRDNWLPEQQAAADFKDINV